MLKRVLHPDFAGIDMDLATAQMSSRRTERVAYRLSPRKAVSKIAQNYNTPTTDDITDQK